MRFESRKDQNEQKRKKKHFADFKKKIIYNFFLVGPLVLHFKDDL